MSLRVAERSEKRYGAQEIPLRQSRQNRLCESSPLGFYGGDTNLYRYVGNGPTNATDPTGLKLVVDNHEIKDAADPMYKAILETLAKSELFKKELEAATEMLDTMIKSPQAKKTYTYSTDDILTEIKFRIYIITIAKELARDEDNGRLEFPQDNKVFSFPSSVLFQEAKVKVEGREVTGMRLAKGTPAEGMKEIRETGPKNPVIADCSSSVALAIHRTYWFYLGMGDAYNKLFDKDHPLVLASKYGLDRFLVKPKRGVQNDLLAGDTQVFENLGAKTKAFEYENTIYLGNGDYYAPGIGIRSEAALVRALQRGSVTKVVTPSKEYVRIRIPNR